MFVYETVAQQLSVTRLDTGPPTAGDRKRKLPAAKTFRKMEIGSLIKQKALQILCLNQYMALTSNNGEDLESMS